MALGAAYSVPDVNFDGDLKKVEDLFAKDSNALPRLENFKKLGHKLIIIQGSSTPSSREDVKEYYDTVASPTAGSKRPGISRGSSSCRECGTAT